MCAIITMPLRGLGPKGAALPMEVGVLKVKLMHTDHALARTSVHPHKPAGTMLMHMDLRAPARTSRDRANARTSWDQPLSVAGGRGAHKSGAIEGVKSGAIEGVKSDAIEGVKSGAIEGVKSDAIEGVKRGAIEGVKRGPLRVSRGAPLRVSKGAPLRVSRVAPLRVELMRVEWGS